MKYITPADHLACRHVVHPSQRQAHITPVSAPLHVITAISNSQRYASRYRLYEAFEKMCQCAGATLWTIELALRDRHHEVTSPDNPHHIQVRSPSEIWHKENLLNLAIARLPANWEYVAWVDADISFARPDWVVETIHQLQHYKVVQMWSHAQDISPTYDLGPHLSLEGVHQSFLYSYATGAPLPTYLRRNRALAPGDSGGLYPCGSGGYGAGRAWHSGYAWAARRSAIADLGGLGDIGILGSADHHMAAALIGSVRGTIHNGMQSSYKKYWNDWQDRAEKYVARNVGYVPGLILHNWHGAKKLRRYVDRWKILVDEKFDYTKDLKRDPQGIYALTERNPRLRDRIREYFRQRNEDSIDL